MEASTATQEYEKLANVPDDTGEVSLQSIMHRSRASEAFGERSLLRALSQHFIVILGECSGIPAKTPPAKAKTRITAVIHLTIILSRYVTSDLVSRTFWSSVPECIVMARTT